MSSCLPDIKIPVYSFGLTLCGLLPGDPGRCISSIPSKQIQEPRGVPLAMPEALGAAQHHGLWTELEKWQQEARLPGLFLPLPEQH